MKPRQVAVALVAFALGAAVISVRTFRQDGEARAAWAEYQTVCVARDAAIAQYKEAKALADTVPAADRPEAERVAKEAEAVAAEAIDHADRLEVVWGQRWMGLGLVRQDN